MNDIKRELLENEFQELQPRQLPRWRNCTEHRVSNRNIITAINMCEHTENHNVAMRVSHVGTMPCGPYTVSCTGIKEQKNKRVTKNGLAVRGVLFWYERIPPS